MKLLITTQILDKNNPILGFFHRWVEEFAKHCEQVIVICLYKGEHSLPSNVQVLSLGKERDASRLQYLIRFYTYIIRERNNYDAVFVHMNQIYMILGGLVWRLWNKRISLWYVHKEVSATLQLAEKITHDVFTSTENSFRLRSSKKHVVGHGIDTDAFDIHKEIINTDILQIISIGRISPVKDYQTLIQATEILKKDGIHVQTTIVGGPGTPEQEHYARSLHTEVEQRGLSDTVVFSGPIVHSAILDTLRKADIFAHMSKTGSLDKAVLEAMAAGVVPLSCNESVAEVIPAHLHPLLLFTPSDSQDLASHAASLFRLSQEERTHIQNQLRDVVVHSHNLPRLITRILSIVDEHTPEKKI